MIVTNLHTREACVEWQRSQILTGDHDNEQSLFFPGEVLVEYNTVHLMCEVLERMVDVNFMQAYRVMVLDVLTGANVMGMATQDVNNPTLFRVRNEDTSQLGRAVLYRPRAQSRASSEDWRTANIIANDWVGKVQDRLNSSPHGDVVVRFDNVDMGGSWACIRWSADLLHATLDQTQRWHMRVGDVVRGTDRQRGVVEEVNDLGGSGITSYVTARFGGNDVRRQPLVFSSDRHQLFARYLMDNMLQPHPDTPDNQTGETPATVREGAVFTPGELQRLLSPERVRQVADNVLPSMFTPNITQQLQGTLSGELLRRERSRVEGELRPMQRLEATVSGTQVVFNRPVDDTFAGITVRSVGSGGNGSRPDIHDTIAAIMAGDVTPPSRLVTPVEDPSAREQRERLRDVLRALTPSSKWDETNSLMRANEDFIKAFATLMTTPVKPVANFTPKLLGGKRKLKWL